MINLSNPNYVFEENDNILLLSQSEAKRLKDERENLKPIMDKCINDLAYLMTNPKENVAKQIIRWRKWGNLFIEYMRRNEEALTSYKNLLDRIYTDVNVNANKRWSKEAEELLVECVCEPDCTLFELSIRFGRSVSAIQSKISQLVGVNKVSQEIAGKFIGTLDGIDINGTLNGTLIKEKK